MAKLSGGKHLSLAADTVDKKTLERMKEAAKLTDLDYNHPLSELHMKELVKEAEVTQVNIGENTSMYVYIPMERSYSQKEQHKVHDRIVKAFGEVYPNTKIFVGWQRLEFSEIEDKAVFKGKLAGTIL